MCGHCLPLLLPVGCVLAIDPLIICFTTIGVAFRAAQALTDDKELFGKRDDADSGPKVSMKKLFSRPKTKVDGTPSKVQGVSLAEQADVISTQATHFQICCIWDT